MIKRPSTVLFILEVILGNIEKIAFQITAYRVFAKWNEIESIGNKIPIMLAF